MKSVEELQKRMKEISRNVKEMQTGYQIAALVIIGMLILTSGLYAQKNHTFEKIQNYIKSKTEPAVSAAATTSPAPSPPSYSPPSSPAPANPVPATIPTPAPAPAPVPAIVVDYAKFEKELAANPMISSIPNGATIVVKTYNFNTGERAWEKSYILTKGSVKEGDATADVTIVLAVKYAQSITSSNFCDIVKQARATGDLGIWTDLSSLQLTWKFKSMFGYRDCLGI